MATKQTREKRVGSKSSTARTEPKVKERPATRAKASPATKEKTGSEPGTHTKAALGRKVGERADVPDAKTKAPARKATSSTKKAARQTRQGSAAAKAAAPTAAAGKTAHNGHARTSKSPTGSPRGGRGVHESNGKAKGRAKGHEHVPAMTRESAEHGSTRTGQKSSRSETEEMVFLRLFEALDSHARERGIGHVVQDPRFDWGEEAGAELRPDLAFVSFDRWAAYRKVPRELTWHVVPDLVVEIVRGAEETVPISDWLEHYFQAGVNRVWVVYPDQGKIHDHDSLSSSRVINRKQTLDGGPVLPGFEIAMGELAAD